MKHKNWWSIDSFYSHYPRDTVLNWCDSDQEINVNRDFTGCKDITYKFNSRGFRSRELQHVPGKINILISGCSHTLGIGIALEETWPEVLSSMIEGSVIHNVAIGGGSCDYVARSIHMADRLVKADMIFVLWPEYSRLEYYQDHDYINLSVHVPDYPKLFIDETHHYNSYLKNLSLVQALAGSRPFYYGSSELSRAPDMAPRARDNLHNCPQWHRALAEAFYIKYQENDQAERFSSAQDIIDYKAQYVDK